MSDAIICMVNNAKTTLRIQFITTCYSSTIKKAHLPKSYLNTLSLLSLKYVFWVYFFLQHWSLILLADSILASVALF